MPKSKNDKILTLIIVVISVVGLVYFGLSAIRSDQRRGQANPFEFDIENFARSGVELLAYIEVKNFKLMLDSPHALAIDSDDHIYVSGGAQISRLDSNGVVLDAGTASRDITALAVDKNGDIYCAVGQAVEVLDSTFTRKALWPDADEQSAFTSIAMGDSAIYVADAGQRIVWHYAKSGALLGRIGDKNPATDVPGFIIPSPYFDVLIDDDGFLWAINTGRHQFENYFPDGRLRSAWEKTSMAIDGFSGCCNPVHVALLSDGSFVTAEKGLVRVKIHNIVGELVGVVALPNQFDANTGWVDVAVNSRQQIIVLDPKRKQIRVFQKKETAL